METLGFFAGGYALLIGGMAIFQRDMIYHPDTSPLPDPAQAGVPDMVPVPVRTADGLLITGWYAPPTRTGSATIIYCHGNARSLAHRAFKARRLLDAGHGVFLVGYRGYGGNPGHPSEQGLYADARAVMAWLRGRGVGPGQMVLYGESLGTGIAVHLAGATEGLAGLVLEAPFTSLADLAPPFLLPGLAQALMVDAYDSQAKIATVTAPLLVLHGEQDGVVPASLGRRLLAAAPEPKRALFLPQGGHNNLWDHGAGEAVLAFLEDLG